MGRFLGSLGASAEFCSAVVSVDLPSSDVAGVVFRSLEPETRVSVGWRSRVRVGVRGRVLVLRFEADDASALRAVLNSYLRWVAMLMKALGCLGD